MSESETPSVVACTWDDPNVCPFCTTELEDPAEGFMAHLDESPVCRRGFDEWRGAVTNDIGGEWSGEGVSERSVGESGRVGPRLARLPARDRVVAGSQGFR